MRGKCLAGLMMAMCSGIAVLTAACGGGSVPAASPASPATAHTASGQPANSAGASGGSVGLSTASANPCLLVTTAEASAIVKTSVAKTATISDGVSRTCTYGPSGNPSVLVTVLGLPLTPASENIIAKASPVPGLGHQAVCGPIIGATGSRSAALQGAIDSGHLIEVTGPSCGVNEQFAAKAYSRL